MTWIAPLIAALVKVLIEWLEKNNAKAEDSKPVDADVLAELRERVQRAEDRSRSSGGTDQDRP